MQLKARAKDKYVARMASAPWFAQVLSECFRVCKNTGHIAMFGNKDSVAVLDKAAHDATDGKWQYNDILVWFKNTYGAGGKNKLRPSWELINFFGTTETVFPDRSAQNFLELPTAPGYGRTKKGHGHQAEKPVELGLRLLDMMGAREGETILDLFSGSGTFAEAAKLKGLNSISVEVNADWCDVVRARVA